MGKPLNACVVLAGAGIVGAIVGVGSVMTDAAPSLPAPVRDMAVGAGIVRARAPQPGDHWGGCNDARQAGTAPIYRGEPGYRENMDGDGDGIACEPYSG